MAKEKKDVVLSFTLFRDVDGTLVPAKPEELVLVPDPALPKHKMVQTAVVEVRGPVEVPGDWLAYCTLWPDAFTRSAIGYWAYGVVRDDTLGWLVRDDEAGTADDEATERDAIRRWRAGEPLPAGFYRLDRAAAIKGYVAMLSRPASRAVSGGFDWYERADANSYDVAIQLALFGQVKYG